MPKQKKQVYAIIRVDEYHSAIEDKVTVKEIVSTMEAAEAEVARLNELNGNKGSRYFWQTTRLILDE